MYNEKEFEMLNKINEEKELDEMVNKAKSELKEQHGDIYSEIAKQVSEEYTLEDDDDHTDNMYDDAFNALEDVEKIFDNTLTDEYDEKELKGLDAYDEAIFPGGPTKTQLDTWKKQWSGYKVYLVEVAEVAFIFRTLNRFEYKQLVARQNIDGLLREEIICQETTLWPEIDFEDLANTMAGIPSSLAEIIMEKSGFTKEFAIQEI